VRVPTRSEFAEVADRAAAARNAAANEKWQEMKAGHPPEHYKYGWLGVSGGARVYLSVDGRTTIGRFLRSLIADPLPGVAVWHQPSYGYGIAVGSGQCVWEHEAPLDQAPAEAGANAALAVFREALRVDGWVYTYERE